MDFGAAAPAVAGPVVCVIGRLEPIVTVAVVGVPRPADFGLVPLGSDQLVPVTSSRPQIRQGLPALQNMAVLACGQVRVAVGTGSFANVRVPFIDADIVSPLTLPLASL